MLKIVKENKFSLRLFEKERTLTRSFIAAFSIAFSIHAAAFALFSIRPFLTKGSKSVSPTAQVHAEIIESSPYSIISDPGYKQSKKLFSLPQTIPEIPGELYAMPRASASYLLQEMEQGEAN